MGSFCSRLVREKNNLAISLRAMTGQATGRPRHDRSELVFTVRNSRESIDSPFSDGLKRRRMGEHVPFWKVWWNAMLCPSDLNGD